jgi:hypothetical protein
MLVACTDEGFDDEFPVAPGAGGGMQLPPVGSMLVGRICISDNLIDRTVCRTDNLADVRVSIGGQSALTDGDGTFRVPMPAGSLLSFDVTGANVVRTTTPFSPSLVVPVVDADVFARTLTSNAIFVPEGTGAILGSIIAQNQPASNVVVVSEPAPFSPPLYDATDSGFAQNATGARGVFFLNGITAGGTNLTLRDVQTGGSSTVAGVQVVNGGITILDSLVLP